MGGMGWLRMRMSGRSVENIIMKFVLVAVMRVNVRWLNRVHAELMRILIGLLAPEDIV